MGIIPGGFLKSVIKPTESASVAAKYSETPTVRGI
jgi:hypothetical protein